MVTDWPHLYGEGWQKEIVPEAFSHPAKFSRALIRHIYDHCVTEGWLVEGDTVIDPFGGVALGGLDAMRLGAHWIGVELEAKFVALGAQNIALWNSRYAGRFAKWGTARLLQGDSRHLLEVIREAGLAVTSPPFSESIASKSEGMEKYKGWAINSDGSNRLSKSTLSDGYGSTPGNLGNLRADEKGFAAALSSPPYIDGARQQGTDNHPERMQGSEFHPTRYDLAASSPPFLQTSGGTNVTSKDGPLSDPRLIERHAAGNAAAGYGDEAASLNKMPEGDIAQVVSSPPYEASIQGPGAEAARKRIAEGRYKGQRPDVWTSPGNKAGSTYGDGYGVDPSNLGNDAGDTFWSAARLIVAQTYAALRPGGHAVWVVKAFVRNKAIVDFPGQWRALCESVGFATLHEHHALLIEDHGTQTAMDGNHKRHIKKRVSFFRRLAEKKGSPPIDYEVCFCMVK